MNRNNDPNMQTKLEAGRFDDGILYKGKTKDIKFWNDSTLCDVIKIVIKMENIKRSKTTETSGRVGIYAGDPTIGIVKGGVSGGRKVKHKEVRDNNTSSRDYGTLLIRRGHCSSYQIEIGYKYTVIVYSKSSSDKSHNEWSKRHFTKDINDTWKECRFLDKHAKTYERIINGSGSGSGSGGSSNSERKKGSSNNKKLASSPKSPSSSSYKVGSTFKGDTKKLESVSFSKLDKGDKAFVKRSDGTWTYGKVVNKKKSSSSSSSEYIEFDIIDGKGGKTRKYYRKDFDNKQVAQIRK